MYVCDRKHRLQMICWCVLLSLYVLSLSEKVASYKLHEHIKFRVNRVCKLCLRHADCFRYRYSRIIGETSAGLETNKLLRKTYDS